MLGRTLICLGLAGLVLLACPAADAAITTSEDLQRVVEEVVNIDLDPARAHEIKSATLTRDMTTIRMDKGVLIFSKEVEGITPVAVFIGRGSLSVTPTRRMDREMLEITMKDHAGKETGGMISTEFTEVFFFGYDGTWKDLKGSLSEARTASDKELETARAILKEQMEIGDKFAPFDQTNDPGADAELGVIAAALGDPAETGETLWAELNTKEFGWLSFGWLPMETYEVRLGKRDTVGAFLDYHPLVVAHRKEDLDEKGKVIADPVADLHELMDVKRYLMDLEVANLEEIHIDVDVTFEPYQDGMRMVWFALVNDTKGPRWDSRAKYVDVLSITDAEGNELPFLHRKHAVIILPQTPPKGGEELTWKFKLNERTINQFSDNHFSLLNTFPWYPQYGYLGGQFDYDWTIKTVKPYTATGSGKKIRTWEEGQLNAVQMVSERPVLFPSIIFGRYQAEEDEYKSEVDGRTIQLAAHSWPQTRFPVGNGFFDVSVPRGKPKSVLEESKTIIKFMEDLFGPYPYDRLDVAMMAPGLGFGQAPPGFVQLTGEAFMSSATIANFPTANADFFHELFAHEIAHQWWAHKLGWIASEDTWLSESFAEYASGLYVLASMGKKRYLDKIREWKEQAENAEGHGSIAWCNNLSGTNGFKYRTQLIYNKGPYIVHMLRMMLGREKFAQAMTAVFDTHAYEMVTTDVIQAEAEKAAGYSLDFFFDQWFRGTGIPTFDYSWTSTPTEDGKHMVQIDISQRDKKNFKTVLMPIYIYFKGQKEPMIRPRPITSADHVYKLKLPSAPERIVLDEDHDILGDMIPKTGSGM